MILAEYLPCDTFAEWPERAVPMIRESVNVKAVARVAKELLLCGTLAWEVVNFVVDVADGKRTIRPG